MASTEGSEIDDNHANLKSEKDDGPSGLRAGNRPAIFGIISGLRSASAIKCPTPPYAVSAEVTAAFEFPWHRAFPIMRVCPP